MGGQLAKAQAMTLDKGVSVLYIGTVLPGGVMVTQLTLDQPFKVRVLARQPDCTSQPLSFSAVFSYALTAPPPSFLMSRPQLATRGINVPTLAVP